MEIFLLRHGMALSVEEDPKKGLSNRGKSQVLAMAKFFKEKECHSFDCIISSPKKRAIETATIFAETLRFNTDDICIREELLPLSSPDEVYNMLKKEYRKYQKILIVAHLPLLSYLASTLISENFFNFAIQFQPASLCKIAKENISSSQGLLEWLISPDLLF